MAGVVAEIGKPFQYPDQGSDVYIIEARRCGLGVVLHRWSSSAAVRFAAGSRTGRVEVDAVVVCGAEVRGVVLPAAARRASPSASLALSRALAAMSRQRREQ